MNNELEGKLKNLTYTVIFGFVILGLLIIGLYFKENKVVSTGTTTNKEDSQSSSSTYDVSKMNEVTGAEAAKLFDKKGTQILYIGRPTCGVCVSLVPELNTVIKDLDVTINYSELKDSFRTDFEDLFDKLDIETKINSNGEELSGTYGELLNKRGFTPLVVIIKDGKMVDGFVGYKKADKIEELFNKYL